MILSLWFKYVSCQSQIEQLFDCNMSGFQGSGFKADDVKDVVMTC